MPQVIESGSWTKRVRGCARVATLLFTLAATCGWLALDALHARANELAGDTGSQLLAFAGAHPAAGTRTLLLNGLALRMRAGTTPDAPDHVLAVLAGRCRARSGQLALQLQERVRGKLPPRIGADPFDPVVQLGDPRGGFAACLDLGTARLDPTELLARARRFSVQADVAELGALRFVWTRREHDSTRYVAVWSDGPLPLRRAFPIGGDAPGTDVPDVPRPPHSRRVLSAWQLDAAPLWVAYLSAQPPSAALDAYRAILRARGYRVTAGPQPPAREPWLLATRGERTTAVIASAHGQGALLSVTPMR